MKKLTLNRETIRQLGEDVLANVQGGAISGGQTCHISRSCVTLAGCQTDLC